MYAYTCTHTVYTCIPCVATIFGCVRLSRSICRPSISTAYAREGSPQLYDRFLGDKVYSCMYRAMYELRALTFTVREAVVVGGCVRNSGADIGTPAQLLSSVPTALQGAIVPGRETLGKVAGVGTQLRHDGSAGGGDGNGLHAHALVAGVGAAHLPPLTLGIHHTLTNVTGAKYVAEGRALHRWHVEWSPWNWCVQTHMYACESGKLLYI